VTTSATVNTNRVITFFMLSIPSSRWPTSCRI
jgi:hypothetical protein